MIDLIVIFLLPPGIISWGVADILGVEGHRLVDRLFGALLLAGGLLLLYVMYLYLLRPVRRDV